MTTHASQAVRAPDSNPERSCRGQVLAGLESSAPVTGVASRSEALTVAVGFSPRLRARKPSRRGATLEPWAASPLHPSLRDGNHAGGHPWAEAHGYHHVVAPRLPETVSHAVAPRRGAGTSSATSRAPAGALPSAAAEPSAFVASRSEALTVAVGFSPRLRAPKPSRHGATLEPWAALPLHPSRRDGARDGGHPWAGSPRLPSICRSATPGN